MVKANTGIMRWMEMRGLPVVIAGQGRKAGRVDDFYFQPGTNAIYALRIDTGILGHRALTTNAIQSIERDAVVIANENMIIAEGHGGQLSQYPQGHELIGYKVRSERGEDLGTVGNVLLAISPANALRIAAFELAGGRRGTFSANEITNYDRDVITIIKQAAKRL